jgi:hypothetical protein
MSIKCLALIFVSILALVSMRPTPAHAAAEEAFICSLKEGKTMENLMNVSSQLVKAIRDLKSGSAYQAYIMTPIASQDLSTVIWIGRMPDFATLAAVNDEFDASAEAKKLNSIISEILDCESRSFWQVDDVK